MSLNHKFVSPSETEKVAVVVVVVVFGARKKPRGGQEAGTW